MSALDRAAARLLPALGLFLAACIVPAAGPDTAPAAGGGGAGGSNAGGPVAGGGPSGLSGGGGGAVGSGNGGAEAPFVGSGSTLQPGDRASSAEQTCDGAHDHCLPVGIVFAYEPERLDEAYVGWPTDDGPWLYIRKDVMRGGAQAWTTERATAAALVTGATIVYFERGATLPRSEAHAVAGTWKIGTVASVNAAAGTLQTAAGADVLIDGARITR